MKQFIPLLVLVMLMKPVWPLVEYIVNYDYIVENFCVNRDRPMLNCDGKCYLAKKLEKESKEKNKNPFKSELTKFELPIINWIGKVNLSLTYFEFVINYHQWHSRFTSRLFTNDILHPPRIT